MPKFIVSYKEVVEWFAEIEAPTAEMAEAIAKVDNDIDWDIGDEDEIEGSFKVEPR